jgi:hypothetical protein
VSCSQSLSCALSRPPSCADGHVSTSTRKARRGKETKTSFNHSNSCHVHSPVVPDFPHIIFFNHKLCLPNLFKILLVRPCCVSSQPLPNLFKILLARRSGGSTRPATSSTGREHQCHAAAVNSRSRALAAGSRHDSGELQKPQASAAAPISRA